MSAELRTPGYFEKVSKGVFIPPLPASGSRSEEWHGQGFVFFDYGSVFRLDVGDEPFVGGQYICRPPSSWLGYDPSLPDRALTKARGKLKEQSVNLAQAFLERRQTAMLLSDTLDRVVKSISALHRRDFRGAVRALELPFSAAKRLRRDQTASSNWLALQYGWKPLLSDLYGSAELLRKRDQEDPTRYRLFVKASARSGADRSPIYDFPPALISSKNVVNWDAFASRKKAKVRLDYSLNDQVISRLASSVGFTNPLTLAWEVTPFSFLVDWFLPIGNYLNQLDASIGLTYLGGSVTERWEVNCDTRVRRLGPSFPRFDVSFSLSRMSWRRLVYALEPYPSFPSFKDPISGIHLANAAALLSVLRRSTK